MHDRQVDTPNSDTDESQSWHIEISGIWGSILGSVLILSLCSFLGVIMFGARYMLVHRLMFPPIYAAFGSCGTPCVIKESPGGNVSVFIRAANRLDKDTIAVIDGLCASGCALFADLGRPYVCVTRKAIFLFHAGSTEVYTKRDGSPLRFDVPHSADIRQYVYELGGFTESDEWADLPAMAYPDTLQFFSECELHPPLPRPRPVQ